ncbi:hypothetical protein MLD38_021377 [Melastoma candidum]|uniref:Uncharacterized protein n=1 Tax=Melastoma candidum TaxID=119954 RepID=A0ACB9QGV1_9MYRT|nr:hypothetical protein MLD38_021377 [Melastoma candidum]
MGRAPCCEKMGLKRGPWTPEEDKLLVAHIEKNGHGNWRALPKLAGLLRCGKSCRLRWINYLRPDTKRGNFTQEEEDSIIKLHEILGNRWSAIAARLPGRTDNEIKNVWHTHLKKRLRNNPDKGVDAKRQPHKSVAKSKRSTDSTAPVSLNNGPSDSPTSPLTTSEVTSMSDKSTAVADISHVEIETEEMEPIQMPVIDESFWSEDLDSFSSIIDADLLSDSWFYNLQAPIDLSSTDCLVESPAQSVQNSEENMDFWYDLLIRTGGVPELSD